VASGRAHETKQKQPNRSALKAKYKDNKFINSNPGLQKGDEYLSINPSLTVN